MANSKPCSHCIKLIKDAKIKYVYYFDSDENGKCVMVKEKAINLSSDLISTGRNNGIRHRK